MAASIDLDYPFAGRWIVQNSPANRVALRFGGYLPHNGEVITAQEP